MERKDAFAEAKSTFILNYRNTAFKWSSFVNQLYQILDKDNYSAKRKEIYEMLIVSLYKNGEYNDVIDKGREFLNSYGFNKVIADVTFDSMIIQDYEDIEGFLNSIKLVPNTKEWKENAWLRLEKRKELKKDIILDNEAENIEGEEKPEDEVKSRKPKFDAVADRNAELLRRKNAAEAVAGQKAIMAEKNRAEALKRKALKEAREAKMAEAMKKRRIEVIPETKKEEIITPEQKATIELDIFSDKVSTFIKGFDYYNVQVSNAKLIELKNYLNSPYLNRIPSNLAFQLMRIEIYMLYELKDYELVCKMASRYIKFKGLVDLRLLEKIVASMEKCEKYEEALELLNVYDLSGNLASVKTKITNKLHSKQSKDLLDKKKKLIIDCADSKNNVQVIKIGMEYLDSRIKDYDIVDLVVTAFISFKSYEKAIELLERYLAVVGNSEKALQRVNSIRVLIATSNIDSTEEVNVNDNKLSDEDKAFMYETYQRLMKELLDGKITHNKMKQVELIKSLYPDFIAYQVLYIRSLYEHYKMQKPRTGKQRTTLMELNDELNREQLAEIKEFSTLIRNSIESKNDLSETIEEVAKNTILM